MEPREQEREILETRYASPTGRDDSEPKRRFRIEKLEERIAPTRGGIHSTSYGDGSGGLGG